MADGTTFVKVTSTQSTPEDYLLSGATSVDLLAVRAVFDGSGAAGDFVPVVQIVNEADEIMLTFVGEKVTAGDSASYTFAPFLKGTATAAGGSGIQFDVSPQTGGFLEVTTLTGTIQLTDQSGTGFNIDSEDSGGSSGFVSITTGDGEVFIGSTEIVNRIGGGPGDFKVQYHGLGGDYFSLSYDGSGFLRIKPTMAFTFKATGGATTLGVNADGSLDAPNLPTVDPGVSGRLWNNAGVVNVSP
jgi:hypothetical protein